MVLPYLKGLIIIKCGFFYIACGYIVYSVFVVIILVDLFRFLTIGIRALSLAGVVGKYFLFLQIFFRRRKKRAMTFQNFLVYFYEKIAETSCISDFLLEKHPSWKKKLSKTESGKSRYWSFKICNFSVFFLRTTTQFFFISVASGGWICPNKLKIWVPLTISPNFKKQNSQNDF